jgi:flagellar hook-length control protein FliK
MQHLATQRSEIAALPLTNVGDTSETPANLAGSQAFEAYLQGEKEAAVNANKESLAQTDVKNNAVEQGLPKAENKPGTSSPEQQDSIESSSAPIDSTDPVEHHDKFTNEVNSKDIPLENNRGEIDNSLLSHDAEDTTDIVGELETTSPEQTLVTSGTDWLEFVEAVKQYNDKPSPSIATATSVVIDDSTANIDEGDAASLLVDSESLDMEAGTLVDEEISTEIAEQANRLLSQWLESQGLDAESVVEKMNALPEESVEQGITRLTNLLHSLLAKQEASGNGAIESQGNDINPEVPRLEGAEAAAENLFSEQAAVLTDIDAMGIEGELNSDLDSEFKDAEIDKLVGVLQSLNEIKQQLAKLSEDKVANADELAIQPDGEPVPIAEGQQAVADEILLADAQLLADILKQGPVTSMAKEPSLGEADTSIASDAEQNPIAVIHQLVESAVINENEEVVLTDLANAVTQRAIAAVPNLSEAQQHKVTATVLANLKELAVQVSQGEEPAIDLSQMVEKALASELVTVSAQQSQVLEQSLQQLTQTLQFGQLAAQQMDQLSHGQQKLDANLADVGQLSTEHTKAKQQAEIQDKPVPIHKEEGQQQLGEKIRWMVNARQSMAEIRLDPPELGSMQVRVNVSGDSATVNIVVQSIQAKDALNEAVPRLREMLADQGIELSESFVSHQGEQQGEMAEQGSFSQQGSGENMGDDMDEDMEMKETSISRRALGEIDDYA